MLLWGVYETYMDWIFRGGSIPKYLIMYMKIFQKSAKKKKKSVGIGPKGEL
jgi:hypothetical protein